MDAKAIKKRNALDTHIVVSADDKGTCRFLQDLKGNWASRKYLALALSEERAIRLAKKVGGIAIPRM